MPELEQVPTPRKPPVPERTKASAWHRIPPQYQTPFRPDAWLGFTQPRATYLTTYELRDDLTNWATKYMAKTKQFPGDAAVYRWCQRDWFGPLPEGRTGRGGGYRIPPQYRYVARLWHVTEDARIRKAGLTALLDDPKSWLVVVANQGSTHYTAMEAAKRVTQILPVAEHTRLPVTIINVGPVAEESE